MQPQSRARFAAAAVALALALALVAAPAAAEIAYPGPGEAEMTLGDPNAPVKVIEYASMSCPHCAAFHIEKFALLRTQFIDAGIVHFTFREYPLNEPAIAAAVLARCAGRSRFFPFVEAMFRQQDSWLNAPDMIASLSQIGRVGGLTAAEFETCLSDRALVDGILAVRLTGEQQFQVQSTPTFIVNNVRVEGNLPWEEFADLLGRAARGESIASAAAPEAASRAAGGSSAYLAISIVIGILLVVAFFFLRRPRAGGATSRKP